MGQSLEVVGTALMGLSLAIGGCGGGASSGADGGAEDAAGAESAAAMDSPPLPADSAAASSSGGGSAEAGVDLSKLHISCPSAGCPTGLTDVSYRGFAGASGPVFCSCEIPCGGEAGACPAGTQCSYIADGPGNVCQ
jgi:hypothetical protein